jgi:hypothetical protein
LTRQGDLGSLAGVLHALWGGGAEDGLHPRRVTQEPGNRNRGSRYPLGGGNRGELLIEFGELGVIQEYAFKEAVLEG